MLFPAEARYDQANVVEGDLIGKRLFQRFQPLGSVLGAGDLDLSSAANVHPRVIERNIAAFDEARDRVDDGCELSFPHLRDLVEGAAFLQQTQRLCRSIGCGGARRCGPCTFFEPADGFQNLFAVKSSLAFSDAADFLQLSERSRRFGAKFID